MPEQNNSSKKKLSLDWLMRGVLTKVGDTFDRLTGRNWAPSSSLATSELIEKLKLLLETEARDIPGKGKFVPHNIKLKMQWDKFSTDSEKSLKKLENELLIAAIDHINDNRYHTYAPLRLEVKPDYFTEGVKLLASFDRFVDEEREGAINVTIPQINHVGNYIPEPSPETQIEDEGETLIARFNLHGKDKQVELKFREKQRRGVGRTKENDLILEDPSVSKIHATLVLSSDKQMMVADTGSTNGTFINDQRIAYGRAFPIRAGDRVKFGNVEVLFEFVAKPVAEISGSQFPTSAASATQRDIQTVAFSSDENVSVNQQIVPKKAVEKVEVEEMSGAAAAGDKPETKSSANGTQDRIVFDFSKEEK